jgi:cytoskeletal protein CcmA (bactofilin family)
VGNIAANGKVEITKEADFTGEIKAGRISVEDGAYLKAVVELKRENTPKPIGAPKPVESEPKLGLASGEAAKAKK